MKKCNKGAMMKNNGLKQACEKYGLGRLHRFLSLQKKKKKKTVGKVGLCETMDKSGMKSLKIKNR